MLVAIVALFVICWAPVLIDNVLTAFEVLPHIRIGGLKHMATAFHLMAYFNSCINPIVYGFMSRNFRESFHKALCRCCRSRRRNPPHGVGSSYNGKRQMSVSVNSRTTSVRYADTR
ncbi:hypothetical protein B566_EDAN013452 [Ephemera danica]|nr:hypothetical protein B566_EDAN013452 [Ephemera danica]